jgi:hypothetical protein
VRSQLLVRKLSLATLLGALTLGGAAAAAGTGQFGLAASHTDHDRHGDCVSDTARTRAAFTDPDGRGDEVAAQAHDCDRTRRHHDDGTDTDHDKGTHGDCVSDAVHAATGVHEAHGDAVSAAAHSCTPDPDPPSPAPDGSPANQPATNDHDGHGDAVSQVARTHTTGSDHDGHGDAVSSVASTNGDTHSDASPHGPTGPSHGPANGH